MPTLHPPHAHDKTATGLAPVVPALLHYPDSLEADAVAQKRGNHTDERGGGVQTSDLAAATAAILELNSRVARADGLTAASRVVVEQLAAHLQLDRVALAWRSSTGRCSLRAISGLPTFDQRSETSELLQAVADEAAARQTDGSWPPLGSVNRHALLAHRRLVEASRVDAAATFVLQDIGRVAGVLIVAGSRASAHDPAHLRFVRTAADCLVSTLSLTARAEGSWLRRSWTQLRRAIGRRALAVMTTGAAIIVAAMAWPVPYRISCRCVIEPMQRRFVVAPHQGLIETSFVQPGDTVRAGQSLARMDGREVRWELAGLEADRRQAQQQRDCSLARGDLSKSELARLEVEQLDAKLELLRRRESLLELTAPLDGIVLSGSIDKLSSAPVETGHVLFEIAPLDQLRVEVAAPAADYRHIVVGDAVELRFDGRLSEPINGKLSRIRPRSEIRDSADVFVTEVELPNADDALRPGQRGSAIIFGPRYPLAWNLFHKAFDRVRGWLP
ncbi:MAG: HlyD family efflux transporter periplasmic adaptor subunit [Planctomycetaceae bacterium]|nr:HlyD family efflux transporter periplasmic adaptor subunit [Planctomycetaceae bacterium]